MLPKGNIRCRPPLHRDGWGIANEVRRAFQRLANPSATRRNGTLNPPTLGRCAVFSLLSQLRWNVPQNAKLSY